MGPMVRLCLHLPRPGPGPGTALSMASREREAEGRGRRGISPGATTVVSTQQGAAACYLDPQQHGLLLKPSAGMGAIRHLLCLSFHCSP